MDLTLVKREGNKKRSTFVINKDLCKHIPGEAKRAVAMFNELADLIETKGNVICISFAESSIAIGAHMALRKDWDFIHTTRDPVDSDFLFFEETHSHAPKHKLAMTDFSEYDTVVFVEDELTTGNTILNLKRRIDIRKSGLTYIVATLVDGGAKEKLEAEGIEVIALADLPEMEVPFMEPGNKFECRCGCDIEIKDVAWGQNSRMLTKPKDYNKALANLPDVEAELVIGTEECSYPALWLAAKIGAACQVVGRSPIVPSNSYEVKFQCSVRSAYDDERIVYGYNFKQYGKVLIVTDGKCDKGLADLVATLEFFGNKNVEVWRLV